MASVRGFLKRENKLAISQIGISTLLKDTIVSAVVFKNNKKGNLFAGQVTIPEEIMTEVNQVASYYKGIPVKMAWVRLFGDMDKEVRIMTLESDIFNKDIFKNDSIRKNFNPVANHFMRTFDFLFKNGLLYGYQKSNSLILTAPNSTITLLRQTYVQNKTNFALLPKKTDKTVVQTLFGKNLFLQSEYGGNTIFGLTSGVISQFLNYEVAKPEWLKTGQIKNPIVQLSTVPVDQKTIIVTSRDKDENTTFELVQIGWEKNIPVINVNQKILATGYNPVIRTDDQGIITYGTKDNTDLNIIPISQLNDELIGFIPTTTTVPTTV